MKKIILIAVLVLIAMGSFAQEGSTPAKAVKGSKHKSRAYICPKCGAVSKSAGTCAHCKVAFVQSGDYFCPNCYASSAKPGKCPKCNREMIQMTDAMANTGKGEAK